ncbi:MAG: PilZ domain-containing protein [Sphingomonadales bacterium]|nr:PilZ domain-containing protein [Sphingomonadales bacterium]MBD3773752.1 PilZ domain-containing protein [Paracoccaceae bacterium]
MSAVDTRNINRDSLFLLAEVRLEGAEAVARVKVRNLSAGGMMAEGDVAVMRGTRLCVNLRNVGCVDGTVAWVQDSRFGIAFAREVDPKVVRAPVGGGDLATPRYLRSAALVAGNAQDQQSLRKI